ncbi:MAG: hypothetical protein IH995_07105 [Proteobacteria bacterium]|nr:hypothetical protein [Pseudomonadota bacterium]
METYEFIIALVSIVVVGGIIRQAVLSKQAKHAASLDQETLARLESLEKLEGRVTVLEKIVTDKKTKLADEIDNL